MAGGLSLRELFSDDRERAATANRISGHLCVDDGIRRVGRDEFPPSIGCSRRSRCCPSDAGRDSRDRYSSRGARRRSLRWPMATPMRLRSEMFL